MNRNQKILAALVAILALTLAYRLTNPFQQETVERLTYAPARSVAPPKAESGMADQEGVRVDLLRSPPKPVVAIHRDPFQPPRAAEPASAEDQKPPQAAPPPKPKSAREKIREQLRRFKTFGSFQHGGETYLFLERGKQVLVVTRGDRIDGKYEILEVADKSVTLQAPNMEEPLTVDLDEL